MAKWSKAKDENKKQEWVGDAVALLIARKFLLENFPCESVGTLHRTVSIITSDAFFNEVAAKMGLYVVNKTKWNSLACLLEETMCEKFYESGFDAAYEMMLPFLTKKTGEIIKKLKESRA